MILALTAEVDGAKPESPVLDFGFGPNDPGAATNGWREGAPWGWLNISGELTQSSGVLSDGSATFRSTLPDGLYEIELETAGVGWGAPFNVRVNGRLAVRGYVASSGCVPGVASRPERIRFPVRVQGGRLDLTLEADRTVGNWRHPVRLRGGSWHLTRLRIYPGKEEPAEPPSEVAYGWEEDDLTAVALPSEVTQVKDARLQSGMRSKSARGTFRADLPAGEYEAELLFAVRGDGTREGPVRMNVVVQGQPVHREFDGGSYRQPVVIQLPVRVEPGESFTLTLERSTPESEWGINALILRKPGFRRPVLDCGSPASAAQSSPKRKEVKSMAAKKQISPIIAVIVIVVLLVLVGVIYSLTGKGASKPPPNEEGIAKMKQMMQQKMQQGERGGGGKRMMQQRM